MDIRKIGAIGIFLFGTVVFIVGQIYVKNFVSFFESISDNQDIQIILVCLFFGLMSMVPLGVLVLVEKKEKSDKNEN